MTLAVLRLMISSTLVDLRDRQFGLACRPREYVRCRRQPANQAAGRHELAKLADRRHQMANRQCRFGVAIEERVGAYQERAGPLLEECGESVINFRFGARMPQSLQAGRTS